MISNYQSQEFEKHPRKFQTHQEDRNVYFLFHSKLEHQILENQQYLIPLLGKNQNLRGTHGNLSPKSPGGTISTVGEKGLRAYLVQSQIIF